MTDKVGSSFFVKPIRWDEGVTRGFIVYPHTVSGDSWGEPLKKEDGTRIKPGTLGGPSPNAVLGTKEGVWKSKRHKNFQDVGNIDWKGPWLSKEKTKREVVTFHGPTQRYWNNGTFTYGADPSHNNIYSKGVVIGIAPQPVLGACIHTTADGVPWLIAMCVRSNRDLCYATRQFYQLRASDLDGEARALAMRVSTTPTIMQDGKYGWLLLSEGLPYEDEAPTVSPETPWFFNVKGTQARTMRRGTHTHSNNNDSGTNEDDTVHREMRCLIDIATLSARFNYPDSWSVMSASPNGYSRWNWKQTYFREQKTYIQPIEGDEAEGILPSEDGYEHAFTEDSIVIDLYLEGQSKLAVDYDPGGDEWVYGWLKGKYQHHFAQYWTIGIDEPNTPAQDATDPPRVANTGSEVGPLPDATEVDGFINTEDNHYPEIWVGFLETADFIVTPSSTDSQSDKRSSLRLHHTKSGSEAVFNEDANPDEADTTLFFIESFKTYLQYADIRHGILAGKIIYDFAYMKGVDDSGNPLVSAEEHQWTGRTRTLKDAPFTDENDIENHVFMNYEFRPETEFAPAFGWTREAMELWELELDSFEESYNYSGKYGNANEDESIFAPAWKTFMKSFMEMSRIPYWQVFDIDKTLYDANTGSVGVYGTTEKDESLVNIVFFDKTSRAVVSASYTWEVQGDPLTSLGGGDRMEPGGLL